MIYINGRYLSKKMTGVIRYASEIVSCFDKAENAGLICILIPNDLIIENKPKFIKIKSIGKLKGNLWEQISLPRFLKKQKNATLLNLCNASPLSYSGYSVIHDISFIHIPSTYPFLFTQWYKFLIKRKVHREKLIFTISEDAKNDICSYYHINENKVVVVYPGVDHILKIKQDDSVLDLYNLTDIKYSLFVGTNYPHKNMNLVIEYAKEHLRENIVLVTNKIKDELPINVFPITSKLSNEQLKSLFAHADNMFLVSSFEGFGLPPLEAIAAGTKQITLSNIPVFREVYGNGVNYVQVNEKIICNNPITITKEYKEALLNKYKWQKSADIILQKIKKE